MRSHVRIGNGSSPNVDRSAAHGRVHEAEEAKCNSRVSLSFPKWCAMLTSQVLRTRTAFSKYLVDSFSSQPSCLAPSPALFPLALPGEFPKMIPGSSSRVRRKIHLERVVYIMVLALNFWHYGGAFLSFEVLRRKPSSQQLAVHKRLRGFLKSEAATGTFLVAAAGRKFPQLDARLAELSSAVTFLGLSGEPYSKAFQGAPVAMDNTVMEELEPYRSLDADRLKLSGSGLWNITEWLPDELCMAYREPSSIFLDRKPPHGEYPLMSDSPEMICKLAKVWDARGLLYLHHEDVPDHEQVRVFNCYKNPEVDRQIGDRRGRNYVECKLVGPSSSLPAATDLLDLMVGPGEKLSVSCSDRKDFYHQLWVTQSRARFNSLGPTLSAEMLSDTSAYTAYCLRMSSKYNRLHHGDRLRAGCEDGRRRRAEPKLRVAFSSILQGDHGGVEFATAAHESLLSSFGCLAPNTRTTASRPLYDCKVADGLVIDDYFAVSIEGQDCPLEATKSVGLHHKAQEAYSAESLLGSPEKDTIGGSLGRVIGVQLNSSDQARRCGMVLASSPSEKRLALSWISLQISQMRRTTDQLHLCLLGGWVSSLLFRRPCMSILNHSFRLVGQDYVAASDPKLLSLPLPVAEELTLLSVLVPVMQTDLAVEMCPRMFATDASKDRGAIVETDSLGYVTEILHRACKSKGAYTSLPSRESMVLREIDDDEWDNIPEQRPNVHRPIAFKFQFIEVFAGASKISDCLSGMGFVVGPPLDLSWSLEYNLRWSHVMAWISYMICEGRLLAVIIEPPCTTFRVMRRPALRDKSCPFGFDPQDPQTQVGNELAHRGFQTLHLAGSYGVAAMLETPNSSKLKNLPSWKRIEGKRNAYAVRCDSCRFGSPHLKSFKFLGVNVNMDEIALRCRCLGKHLQVQGQYTKKSATYTDALASAIASVFAKAILTIERVQDRIDDLEVDGKENLLGNEVVKTSPWEVSGSWAYKSPSHINLLELAAIVELSRRISRRYGQCRVLSFVDSFVTRGACSKGRSASGGITKLLRRLGAISVSAGLYFTTPFCPTRLNPADDPTRLRDVRAPQQNEWLRLCGKEELYKLATHKPLRRWAANWASIMVKLMGVRVLDFKDRSLYRSFPLRASYHLLPCLDFDSTLGFPGEGPLSLLALTSTLCSGAKPSFDFDSTLGFPGEGPLFFLALISILSRCSPPSWCLVLSCLCPSSPFPGAVVSAMPITSRNARDMARAGTRANVELVPGRQVLPVTNTMRASLRQAFLSWTEEEAIPWTELMKMAHLYVDEINAVIVRYGRGLYEAGRPYNHYAETINAIATDKPSIRRLLQPAWNLAFGWLQNEPNVHHVCMPAQVLLALLTVALMWGWDRVAGVLGLGWGALLRAGELISATKSQLLLPSDVFFSANFCLFSILEPKTRFTAARHQSAKLDASDLVALAELSFAGLVPSQRLWPYSGQTLRTRLRQLLAALWLPVSRSSLGKPLDLGSLRAGGATWLLQTTEDAELTRRRGRWINAKTMEIYIQEIQATAFFVNLPLETRRRIVGLSLLFPEVLQKCISWKSAKIPSTAWPILFSHP